MIVDPANQAAVDEQMMGLALREAERALDTEDVPVGAVVVRGGRVIGRGCNQREALQDPTAHAEMIALTAAAAEMRSWRTGFRGRRPQGRGLRVGLQHRRGRSSESPAENDR
jgi:pyrimidine deaminase RibD-like protein